MQGCVGGGGGVCEKACCPGIGNGAKNGIQCTFEDNKEKEAERSGKKAQETEEGQQDDILSVSKGNKGAGNVTDTCD